MSGDKLKGCRLHVWHGRDPIEDTISLAQAVAASPAELFNCNDRFCWPNDGHLDPVSKDLLREIIAKHICTRRLVDRGTREPPVWECEYLPFDFGREWT